MMVMWCRKLEAEGAVQDPWARLAHAAALAAAGDGDAAAAVLATALQAFHVADKSEVHGGHSAAWKKRVAASTAVHEHKNHN